MVELLDEISMSGVSERVDVFDPLELDTTSTMTKRFTRDMHMYRYMLLDRSLLGQTFDCPIARHLTYEKGEVMVCKVADRFATQIEIRGDGVDSFCFSRMTSGRMLTVQEGQEVTSEAEHGLAIRAVAGSRMVTGDGAERVNVWLSAGLLEGTLEHLIGDHLRRPLRFRPDVAWDRGVAASVSGLFRFFEAELGRPDGLTSHPTALRSFYETLARSILLGLPNTYSERLSPGWGDGVPAYIRRAEEFMQAHAVEAIGIKDVAQAAGCGVRTLEAAYRRFRETTPLAALHAIRLDQVRAELLGDANGLTVTEVARRYGFTNRHRFRLAFQQRFGSPPPSQRSRKPDAGVPSSDGATRGPTPPSGCGKRPPPADQ